ncbi:fungal chitosanase [Colletotrichum caudatum]|nr:fungal chitosanase [Colletotrichum caudatum]
MISLTTLLVLLTLLVTSTLAIEIPRDVKNFYSFIKVRRKCKHALSTGFHSVEDDSGDFVYCGDFLDKYQIIYLQGKKGSLANMDVDCDGAQGGGDGRCGSSTDTQSETTFRDVLRGYNVGPRDLNASLHPYVVFGNQGTKSGWPTFDPRQHGVKPLSVMAVICNDKVVYGIWGDTNGDDGPQAMIGEASISLATACYGDVINGNAGHDEDDVLYIAFTGDDAVPGANGAAWNASTYDEFESSITDLGNKLLARVGSGCDRVAGKEKWLLYATVLVGSALVAF